ncbi:UNVERIFIED_CONTAM: protein SCAR3 [Sesamum calycinum]|uniref:Protein SCAR n=1 Tax=Sesamum calycinum TaxID=2727403 RepID=A0AAW2Q6U5_9LAMI
MPLVRVEVRNEYGLGAPEMYREGDTEEPDEILQGVAVAGLVGVLRQLGDLADFAAEVFHGLQEEVVITSSRSHKLTSRVQRIEAALSPLEKAVLAQRTHLHFAYTAGSSWHARLHCEKNLLVCSDLPQFILDSYEDCCGPPRLDLLDRFDPGGPGSCLKRYSDPTFFKRAASGEAGTPKVSKANQGYKINTHNSTDVGGHTSPSQKISPCDAAIRSDLSEHSYLDLRNGPGHIGGDFHGIYSVQPKEQESREFIASHGKRHDRDCLDYNFLKEKISDEALPTSESGDIHLDSFESETDHFTDALNSIDPESETDIDCIRKPEIDECTKLEDKAAEDGLPEMIKHNLDCQNSNPESNIWANNSIITGGCEHNPVSVSPKPPSAACYSISRVATRDESNSLCPVDEALLQSVQMAEELSNPGSQQSIDSSLNGDTNDAKNVASVSCAASSNLRENRSAMPVFGDKRSSLESQKPAPETSSVASVTIWTTGGLLGLQPSKPPDFSVLNALPQDPLFKKDGQISSSTQYLIISDKDRASPVKTESSQNIEECLDMDGSTCQEKQESGISSKKTSWKISPADLGIRVGKRSDSFSPNNFSSSKASVTASGNVLPVNPGSLAARKLQEVTKSSSQMFELSNKLLKPGGDEKSGHTSYQNANALRQRNHQNFARQAFTGRTRDPFGGESQIPSPPSSPPLAHMKISFQPIDGFETSRLKLKFPYGNTNDESSRDVFPLFQLVPEVSITQHNIGSDSEDDTFHGSSPSLSDDCHSHQSESILSSGSPESLLVLRTRTFDLQSMETLNRSLREELRNDANSKDPAEPEAATTPDPPPYPLNGVRSNGLREAKQGKSMDEKEDFLQQIRTKSFNLRPTVTARSTVPLGESPNIQVTAILKKANAIRQAVGSDDGEDDGNWSDT